MESRAVHHLRLHILHQGGSDMSKRTPLELKVKSENYGTKKFEETFKNALKPYFQDDQKKLSAS